MCGIAGVHRRGTKQIPMVNDLADNLWLGIEKRGPHATGFLALLKSGKVQLEKAPVTATRFIAKRKGISPAAKSVLLHTRYATVGSRTDVRNAHPVASGNTAAIHNGTIYNATAIFETFGLKRRATVDSEVIPAIVEHSGWDKAKEALALLEGGAATAIINTDHPEELILARLRGYPLVYLVTKDLVVWASTRHAIEHAWLTTYGNPAPRGKWVTLPEYTMVRINGRIGEHEEIPAKRTDPPKKRSTTTVYGTPVSKRARRRARKAQQVRRSRGVGEILLDLDLTLDELDDGSLTTAEMVDREEPYMTRAVGDLMKAGFSHADAVDMVYGWTPPWIEEVEREEELALYGTPYEWIRDAFD